MYSKFFLVVAFVVGLGMFSFALSPDTIAQTAGATLSVEDTTTSLVATDVPITLNCPDPSCDAVQFQAQVDPTQVQINSVTIGDYWSQSTNTALPVANTFNATTGQIDFAVVTLNMGHPPKTGNGTVAIINVTPLVEGTHTITLSDVLVASLNGSPVSTTIENGQVIIPTTQPSTFACTINIPTSVVRGQTVTGDIVCNNIPTPGVYGAQACFNITGVAITPIDGDTDANNGFQLSAGTLFQGNDTLSLANSFDATGGCYGLSLSGLATPFVGDAVLAQFRFVVANPGVVNLELRDTILATYDGVALPNLQLIPVSLPVLDGDLADLQGIIRRQAGGVHTTTLITVDSQPAVITDNGDGLAGFVASDLPAMQVTLSASSGGHLACSNPITLTTGINTLPSEILLYAGDTNNNGITVQDAVIISFAFSGTVTPDTVPDINGDGRVTIEDLIWVGRNLDRMPDNCQP